MFSFQGASQSYVHAPLDFVSSIARSASFSTIKFLFQETQWNLEISFAVSVNFLMVESTGIEPVTSCLQGRRSPSWANPPSGIHFKRIVVGQNGLEPSTSRLSVVCSSQLSYWPILGSTILFSTVPSKLNNVKTLTSCTDLRTLLTDALLC